jgi:hypothetical protein
MVGCLVWCGLGGIRTTSEVPVAPFAHVTIGDANVGAIDTLTITLGGAGGTLADGSGFGLTSVGSGVYALSGTPSAIISELDALIFTPAAGVPNTFSTTTFEPQPRRTFRYDLAAGSRCASNREKVFGLGRALALDRNAKAIIHWARCLQQDQ